MPVKKDDKYFISKRQYNCPYCGTGAVRFKVIGYDDFDWSNEEKVRLIRIECQEPNCKKNSLHMTKHNVGISDDYHGSMTLPKRKIVNKEKGTETEEDWDENKIDELFFFHQPNSTFIIDNRIPKKIRKALDEASTAHKMGLSIGSSAALRKAIFELLAKFEIPKIEVINDKDEPRKIPYYERLDLLKKRVTESHSIVDLTLLDDIKKIYSLCSQPLHERLPSENEWEDFNPAQFLFLLEVVHTLLIQIFIIPSENEDRKGKLSELAKKVPGLNKQTSQTLGR